MFFFNLELKQHSDSSVLFSRLLRVVLTSPFRTSSSHGSALMAQGQDKFAGMLFAIVLVLCMAAGQTKFLAYMSFLHITDQIYLLATPIHISSDGDSPTPIARIIVSRRFRTTGVFQSTVVENFREERSNGSKFVSLSPQRFF